MSNGENVNLQTVKAGLRAVVMMLADAKAPEDAILASPALASLPEAELMMAEILG